MGEGRAALANSGGGVLVVGVATSVSMDREEEIASEVMPFPADMVNVKQHRDALDARSGVYPTLRDVRILPFERDDGKALLLVVVPRQNEDQRPFLVVRMVEGDEKRGIGVGVPFRGGPHTYWVSAGELHRDLSDGRRARTVPPSVASFAQPASATKPLREMTDRRLTSIEEYMGWDDAPTYLLGAVPAQPQEAPVPRMYDPDGIWGCVRQPPEIRHAGFSLAWPETPRNEDGSLVNLISERSVLWVDPDGTCLAAAAGTPAFLARASTSPPDPRPQQLNATVLVEWTYLFCLFVERCMAESVEGGWRFAARLRGARSRPWSLRLERGQARNFSNEGREPGMDEWFAEFDGRSDAGADAFAVLSSLYQLFGLDHAAIPFVTDGRVDPEKIKAVTG